MFYKVAISKRGVKCSKCSKFINKGLKYFTFFHWEKDSMQYPINEKICLNCAYSLTNFEFIHFLEKLLKCTKKGQSLVNSVRSEQPLEIEEPIF